MPAPVLQFKRGNAGVAGTVPALRPGEPAISLNNFDFFIGIDTSVINNKFFGSHRYWEREESGVKSLKLKLVSDNGSESINLTAPIGLGATFTYTLPATGVGNSGKVLSTNEQGVLSWIDSVNQFSVEQIVIGIGTFSNDVGFTTDTNNTLGNPDTGAVQIDGGLGVNKNVTVGAGLSVVEQSYFLGTATFYNNAIFTNTTDNTLGNYDTGAVQISGGLGVQKNLTVGAGLSVGGESYFIGTATFYGGQLNLGDSDGDNINVAGEFVSNLVPNATNTYDLGLSGKRWKDGYFGGNLDVTGNLVVDGNVTIGGTTVTLLGQDVYIQNKDIILGYTTSITGDDASTDDTANHAGVAIASTVGTPLVSFSASGINTLPDTYKQLMWFKQGTLGFGTDAFAFNYGLAIGTTTMADGVRLAVGSNITMTDSEITATTGNFTNLTGSLSGTISTATSLQNAQDFSITGDFITAPIIAFNGTSAVALAATITANSIILGTYTSGDYVASITSGNGLTGGTTGEGSTPTLAVGAGEGITVNADDVALKNGTNLTDNTVLKWDNTNGQLTNTIITENGTSVIIGTGVGITQFSGSVSTGTSTSSVPTSSAVIDYVNFEMGAMDLTLGINADTGGPSTVSTSETLTISGTASEIETSVSGQTITIGLPDAVVVGTSLSAPTLRTGTIQSSNTGATALTLQAGDVTVANDLTVQGNLYVQGATTQIDTTTLAIEDRTIELGRITSATQPTTTTWDLAVLFNYGDSGAKKAGLVWEASGATKRFQFTTDVDPGTDGSDSQTNLPSFTVSNFAPIEIGQLWVTDCAGTSQVISCTGTERFLENITVDAGVF